MPGCCMGKVMKPTVPFCRTCFEDKLPKDIDRRNCEDYYKKLLSEKADFIFPCGNTWSFQKIPFSMHSFVFEYTSYFGAKVRRYCYVMLVSVRKLRNSESLINSEEAEMAESVSHAIKNTPRSTLSAFKEAIKFSESAGSKRGGKQKILEWSQVYCQHAIVIVSEFPFYDKFNKLLASYIKWAHD